MTLSLTPVNSILQKARLKHKFEDSFIRGKLEANVMYSHYGGKWEKPTVFLVPRGCSHELYPPTLNGTAADAIGRPPLADIPPTLAMKVVMCLIDWRLARDPGGLDLQSMATLHNTTSVTCKETPWKRPFLELSRGAGTRSLIVMMEEGLVVRKRSTGEMMSSLHMKRRHGKELVEMDMLLLTATFPTLLAREKAFKHLGMIRPRLLPGDYSSGDLKVHVKRVDIAHASSRKVIATRPLCDVKPCERILVPGFKESTKLKMCQVVASKLRHPYLAIS